MKRMLTLCASVPLALTALTGSAAAEEVSCPPNRGAVTLDNVRVIGSCTMTRTNVQGNIVVEDNAALYARGVRVIGSVQSEGATRIRLVPDATTGQETGINGDVQIKNSAGTTLVSQIQDAQIGGTALIDDNQVPHNLYGNNVGGDVQVFQNDGVVRIRDNTIDGNLQCKANNPNPIDGGGNVVHGNAEDQCAGFDSN